MRHNWDKRFLDLARHVSQWSKDPSTRCGAVIARPDKTIASVGYNGFPRSVEDKESLLSDRDEKYKRIIHAEMNAILFLRESVAPSDGYTLYTWPMLPCIRCIPHIAQSGIRRCVSCKPAPFLRQDWHEALRDSRHLLVEAHISYLELQ